jgi:hypothetical protein
MHTAKSFPLADGLATAPVTNKETRMSTEHPTNYLTLCAGGSDEIQGSLNEFLASMKEQLGGEDPSTQTISSGSITPTNGAHAVDAETGSSDDLSHVVTTNLVEGQLLLLWPVDGKTITVKHEAGGAGQITLSCGHDLVMDDTANYVLLQRQGDDWQETGRLGDFADLKRLEAVNDGVMLSQEGDMIDLNKGSVKVHAEAGGADHTASGTISSLTAGEALAFGDICYPKSDGKYWKADADDVADTPSVVMALETIAADASGSFLLRGFARDDSWSLTVGGAVYASTTAGSLTQTSGGAVLGVATNAVRIHFTPGMAAGATQAAGEVEFDADAGGADHTASGITMSMTAGEALVFGNVCYLKSDGKLWKANADSSTTMPATFMALETIAVDATGDVLVHGVARDDTWDWTVGGAVYASTTDGGLTQTVPSTTEEYVQVVGLATHADRVLFNPCLKVASHSTIDLCTGGTATASGYSDSHTPDKAFDDDYAMLSYWYYYNNGGYPEWIKYELTTAKAATKYKMTNYPGSATYYPTQWKLQGSNNDSSWTDLDTRSGVTWTTGGETKEFTFSNSTEYKYYRWYIEAGENSTQILITELELFL